MQGRKINAGVTLMQDFCAPGSDVFKGYIDYINREEAQRNNAISTFNLFNDYMGNPVKSTGLFTEDKDALTYTEKQELKSIFELAQKNESLMWQTVISFDNLWIEKNGLYDSEKKILDEQKVKETVRLAINRLLKSEGLEHAVWSAAIHYNTDNIHVHIATVEPYPMREKMIYDGNLEVRGKFKLKNINKSKSTVVNEIMQTKEINQRINKIIRKDIVEHLKGYELAQDTLLKEKFLQFCEVLPAVPRNMQHYNNAAMSLYQNRLDEISNIFLEKYCPEQYHELLEILNQQSALYEEAYGGRNFGFYKEDKIHDLMKRMGNATLNSAKNYISSLQSKETDLQAGEKIYAVKYFADEKNLGEAQQQEADIQDVIEDVDEELLSNDSLSLRIKERDIPEELAKELLEAETFLFGKSHNEQRESGSNYAESGKSADTDAGSGKPTDTVAGSGNFADTIYGKYFKAFKEIKKELYSELRKDGSETVEALLQEIYNAAKYNPFVEQLLGEMYLHGQFVDISEENAQKHFQSALSKYKRDINGIPEPQNGRFDFSKYLAYRIGKLYDRGWGAEENPEMAAEWYEKSGQSYAMYSLGMLYYQGRGVEQDYKKAYDIFSSLDKNPFAQLKCAVICEEGIGIEQDITKAELHYEDAFILFNNAERKGPDALFEYQIGNMYYHGKGCEQNTEKAVHYLRMAVKQKNVPAMLLLANIYINENIISDDMPELIKELEKLAAENNINAQYTLGKIYIAEWKFKDFEKGMQAYEQAAAQGHQYAQYQLGKLYTDPELEIYDLEKGIKYLESSAEQGNRYAQYLLGKLYTNPELEIYDLEKGIQYLKEAAEQGYGQAQYQLGKLYMDQQLEIYDLKKGIHYLEEAAAQGHEYAKYSLGVEYLNQSSAAYDPEKGMEYISELAEAGNEWAQVKMGFEHLKGEHVEYDLKQAKEWFRRAANQGNEVGQKMLNNMAAKRTKIPLRGASRKSDIWNELDKAMFALRRSFYEAQKETRKNILLYEYDLENQEPQINE